MLGKHTTLLVEREVYGPMREPSNISNAYCSVSISVFTEVMESLSQ